ncbi:MAG: histidine kinase [Bacteroidetes bacterium]|nr:histidine kinase [Bacteroidota bacterium]
MGISYQKLFFILGGWYLLWLAAHTFIVYQFYLDFYLALTDSLLSNIPLFIICSLLVIILKYYQPNTNNIVNLLVWILVLSAIYIGLLKLIFPIFIANTSVAPLFEKSTYIRYCVALLLMSFVLVLSWVWQTINEIKLVEQRKLQIEQLAKDAELNSIKQQLQPHFLFNSLNSISALITIKPEDARKMISQLSDFFRGTLKNDTQQLITIEEEIKYLQLYLDIEKIRFSNRLDVAIELDSALTSCKLPSLLLQPVVENAIKYGLYDTTEKVLISISTKRLENDLVISISNPYDNKSVSTRNGTGFGLSSISRRLLLLYGRNDLLELSQQGNIFTTTIKIPQHA